jgi:hypothetical protein
MPRVSRSVRLTLATLLACAVGTGAFLAWRTDWTRENLWKRDKGIASRVARAGVTPPASPAFPQTPPSASAAAPIFASNALFAFAPPANAAQLDTALPAPAHAVYYVRLNAALIEGKRSPFWQKPGAGRVELPLPDGGALVVVIDESTMLGADRFTSTGHLEGRPQSRAVFAWNKGFLHASIDDAEFGSYALRAATVDFAQFYRVDPALVGPCGGERHPLADAATIAAAVARRTRAAELAAAAATSPAASAAATTNPQHAEVQVMMAYTQSVLATLNGAARTAALQSAFDAAIAKMNSDLAASAVTARVKLVRIAETQYDENAAASGSVQDAALTALYLTADGKMDELHPLRDQAGADLVCLALNRVDFASTGLAFVLDKPGDNFNPLYGFSVVQYSAIAGTSLVSHELGHNLGCVHDREHTSGPGAYPYSYGYRFTATDGRQYHDIMSYDPGTGLSFYSNPALNAPAPAPANSPGGIAPGSPGESDTSLTIEQDAFEVASYRLQTQAAASAGTLINVSTRAFVGAGDQVLIGGFVITGTTAKRMLLRAAGPALGALGLASGTLADPVLDLYTGPTLLQTNDNWSSFTNGTTATDLAAAAAQAGAFPFANGSTDAALLVTLTPGAYTAVVRGAGGLTGTALVEAYEVGAAANRIINLSTRGYADNADHPMIGGFVVSVADGSTKRILIRVRGPSLARDFGVAGAMNDPCMELHNAAGDLLLKNDDWSSGTVAGTANAVNDFQPLVRFYSEQQIVATGFAPVNRREPCVLVDLPPGNYTVVVKPFEDLTISPPEPAAPGVALVEVFEISP